MMKRVLLWSGLICLAWQSRGATQERPKADPTFFYDKSIPYEDVEDGPRPLLTLDANSHLAPPSGVALTSEGQTLLSVAGDYTLRVWDTAGGKQLRVLHLPRPRAPQCLALAPDEKLVAIGLGKAPGGPAPAVLLFDWQENRIVHQLAGHEGGVDQVVFSPDGKLLASVDDLGKALLWNLKDTAKPLEIPYDHKAHGVAFAPDSGALVVNGLARTTLNINGRDVKHFGSHAEVLDLVHDKGGAAHSCKPRRTFPSSELHPGTSAAYNHRQQAAWSPDGKTLALTASHDLFLSAPDGTNPRRMKMYSSNFDGYKDLRFSPDSALALCLYVDNLTAVDAAAGVKAFQNNIPKEKYVEWDGIGGYPGVRTCAIAAKSHLAAVSGGNQCAVFMYDLAQERPKEKSALPPRLEVRQKIGGVAKTGKVAWPAAANQLAWRTHAPESGVYLRALPPEKLGKDNRSYLASLMNRTFDLNTMALTKYEKFQSFPSLHGIPQLKEAGGTIGVQYNIVDVETKKPAATIKIFPELKFTYEPLATLPNNRLVVGSTAPRLFFYDLPAKSRGKPIPPTKVLGNIHTGAPADLKGNKDGKYLLTCGGYDGMVRVIDAERMELLLSLFVQGNDWVAWTPQGFYAASPAGEQFINWRVSQGPDQLPLIYPAAHFRKIYYRPDVVQRVLPTGSVAKALAAADLERGTKTEAIDVEKALPPRLTIKLAQQDGKAVRIEATSQGGSQPLQSLQLLLNGRPVPESLHSFKTPAPAGAQHVFAFDLPEGAHRLSVLGRTPVGHTLSNELSLSHATKKVAPPGPQLYVLAVGINAYPGDYRLNCAVNDASTLAKALEQGGQGVYQGVNKKLRVDKEADLDSLLKDLDWLKDNMTPRDLAVIFLAGHGYREPKGDFFFCPHGVQFNAIAKTGLAGKDIKKRLQETRGRILLMLDACHSGGIGGVGKRQQSLTDDLVNELAGDESGIVVMYSAMGKEEAQESKTLNHGLFTLAMLEGLGFMGKNNADYNRDGVIHLTELELYLENRVTELSRDEQHPGTVRSPSVRSFPLAKVK